MTNLKKFDTNIEPEKKFSSKKYFYSAILGLLFLGVIEIWLNNIMATFGVKYEGILKLEQSLKMQNQLLENKLATQLSLSNIATKSAELGFSKPGDIKYLH